MSAEIYVISFACLIAVVLAIWALVKSYGVQGIQGIQGIPGQAEKMTDGIAIISTQNLPINNMITLGNPQIAVRYNNIICNVTFSAAIYQEAPTMSIIASIPSAQGGQTHTIFATAWRKHPTELFWAPCEIVIMNSTEGTKDVNILNVSALPNNALIHFIVIWSK